MHKAFEAKNKLHVIDGSMSFHKFVDLNRVTWERCKHLIHSRFINSVFDSFAQTILHENSVDV